MKTKQYTTGALTVSIRNNTLTVAELCYPTHHFTIVDKVPAGYKVWNIGKHMPSGYIPYAQVDSDCRVNTETLKALKIN